MLFISAPKGSWAINVVFASNGRTPSLPAHSATVSVRMANGIPYCLSFVLSTIYCVANRLGDHCDGSFVRVIVVFRLKIISGCFGGGFASFYCSLCAPSCALSNLSRYLLSIRTITANHDEWWDALWNITCNLRHHVLCLLKMSKKLMGTLHWMQFTENIAILSPSVYGMRVLFGSECIPNLRPFISALKWFSTAFTPLFVIFCFGH